VGGAGNSLVTISRDQVSSWIGDAIALRPAWEYSDRSAGSRRIRPAPMSRIRPVIRARRNLKLV